MLVVDDDPEVVKVVTLILEPEGFRVVSAADGPSGLARARAERPDLVLLDVSLPGASGLDVCRALRAADDPHLRNVPVVMVSGFSAARDTAAGFAAGATDFLAKPFRPAHVLSRIQAWIAVHGNRQAAPRAVDSARRSIIRSRDCLSARRGSRAARHP